MPTFIQLLKLLPEGRNKLVQDPDSILYAQRQTRFPGVSLLGIYAILGEYDFVNIVEAPDNEAVARYSLHLGQTAGVDVTTMPAIPMARFADGSGRSADEQETGASKPLPSASEETAPG